MDTNKMIEETKNNVVKIDLGSLKPSTLAMLIVAINSEWLESDDANEARELNNLMAAMKSEGLANCGTEFLHCLSMLILK